MTEDQGRGSPPLDEDALRLVIAFYSIMEPERQAEVLALAEKHAGAGPDGVNRPRLSTRQ